jgi:hypothetical protein
MSVPLHQMLPFHMALCHAFFLLVPGRVAATDVCQVGDNCFMLTVVLTRDDEVWVLFLRLFTAQLDMLSSSKMFQKFWSPKRNFRKRKNNVHKINMDLVHRLLNHRGGGVKRQIAEAAERKVRMKKDDNVQFGYLKPTSTNLANLLEWTQKHDEAQCDQRITKNKSKTDSLDGHLRLLKELIDLQEDARKERPTKEIMIAVAYFENENGIVPLMTVFVENLTVDMLTLMSTESFPKNNFMVSTQYYIMRNCVADALMPKRRKNLAIELTSYVMSTQKSDVHAIHPSDLGPIVQILLQNGFQQLCIPLSFLRIRKDMLESKEKGENLTEEQVNAARVGKMMRIELGLHKMQSLVQEREEYAQRFPEYEEVNSILFRIVSNITDEKSIKNHSLWGIDQLDGLPVTIEGVHPQLGLLSHVNIGFSPSTLAPRVRVLFKETNPASFKPITFVDVHRCIPT